MITAEIEPTSGQEWCYAPFLAQGPAPARAPARWTSRRALAAGGSVDDALVGAAAREADLVLVTAEDGPTHTRWKPTGRITIP